MNDKATFKLKLYTIDEDGLTVWMPTYVRVDSIIGFYVPFMDNDDERSINLFTTYGAITVKNEPHIEDYLYEEFADKAISS